MNPAPSHNVIAVSNLTIGYKSTVVAEGINLIASEGELVVIVGKNGIGKSTLLRTLGKVQPKLSGQIHINGKSLDSVSPAEMAEKISVVLTEAIPSKNLTVRELIALGRQPYTNWLGQLTEVDMAKIAEVIQMLALTDLKDKPCYELSDGQLQRVMIARALAQDTPIILLDEPTTHLDIYHKAKLLKLMKHIAHTTKKTILFTSHEIEMSMQLCDKLLVLDGKNNPFGTPESLIRQKAFETLFPNDTVVFNANTKSFQIK